MYSCSKLAFVLILMFRIKLRITIIIGQLILALRKPVLSHAVDPAIIEQWRDLIGCT